LLKVVERPRDPRRALLWLVAIVLVLTAVFSARDLLVHVGEDIESPAAPKG
jgi:hypothetical protein